MFNARAVGFITAGEAVMSIPGFEDVSGRRCYRIEFTVTSLPSFNWVYKVEDRYLTFIDADKLGYPTYLAWAEARRGTSWRRKTWLSGRWFRSWARY